MTNNEPVPHDLLRRLVHATERIAIAAENAALVRGFVGPIYDPDELGAEREKIREEQKRDSRL